LTPVHITAVNKPLNGENFTRYVYFNLTLDEKAKYLKYSENTGRYIKETTLCSNCNEYGYKRKASRYFSRGVHNITLFTLDEAGNIDKKNIDFVVS